MPVLVGMSLGASLSGTPLKWWLAACAIASSIFIQISTNLVNDALDFKKGTDTEKRLGPVRVSASGLIKPEKVLWGAYAAMAMAALLGIPLVKEGGAVIVWVGIFSLIAAYVYTGGPYPLAYNGLGDFFVVIFFGFVAVGGSYFLQTHSFSMDAFVAGLQVGALATVLIAINNLRDVDEDSKNNKKTLAVRFGEVFVKREILFLHFLALVGLGWWCAKGFRFWWLPLLVLPLMSRLTSRLKKTAPSKKYNEFLAQAAAVHLLFGILLMIAFQLGLSPAGV